VTTVRFLGDVPVTAAVALGLIGSGLGLAYEQGARAIISGAETLSPDNLSALMDAGMDWASDQTLGLLKLAAVEALAAVQFETIQSWAAQGAQGVRLVGDNLELGLDRGQALARAGLDVVGQPGRLQSILDEGTRFAQMQAGDLAALAASGFDRFVATSGDLLLDAPDILAAVASGAVFDALAGQVGVRITAAQMAALTLNEIHALARAGAEVFQSVGDVALDPDQYQAIAQAGLDWSLQAGQALILDIVDNPQLVEDLQTLQAFGFTTVRLAGDVQLGAQAALGLIGSGLELAYQEGARAIVTGAGALSSADLSALLEAGDVWVDDQMRGLLKLAAAEVLNTLPLATLQSWAEQGAQGVFLVGDTVQTGLDQARIFVTAGLDVVGQPGRLQDIIDDGVRIALLEASDLADLAAAGFDRLIATGGDMTLDLAAALEASASGLALDALNGVVAVKVSAQDMASLTVDQIAALGRIGVETFDSVGEVLINPDQYLAAAQAGLHWGKLWGESLIFMVGLQHPQLLAAAAELKAFGVTTVRFLGDVPVTAAVALGLIGSGLGLAYEQGARAIISE
jgi:hypothetical protein